jgi:ribosomal protein S18 acetylase RimI-like enzyme
MIQEDIPAGLALCRSARWNQTSHDWELFLKLNPQGCYVATDDSEKVIGTVATLRYEEHFSWIGMVLVDPSMQRQGIGIQLLREALRILSDEETLKLDATSAGREVYLQLNFTDEYPISRMQADELRPPVSHESNARPIRMSDLPSIVAFDREVFGANRQAVLEWFLNDGNPYGFVAETSNRISGYCLGRPGHDFAHIGPVVADDFGIATELASLAFKNCAGVPVVMDALRHTPEWIEWLSSVGFKPQRTLIRMYRGSNAHPGSPQKQYAILGPEFG